MLHRATLLLLAAAAAVAAASGGQCGGGAAPPFGGDASARAGAAPVPLAAADVDAPDGGVTLALFGAGKR
jgi:hypothetical protein